MRIVLLAAYPTGAVVSGFRPGRHTSVALRGGGGRTSVTRCDKRDVDIKFGQQF